MTVAHTARLAILLEKTGLFQPTQVETLLERKQETGASLLETLLDLGYAAEDAFLQAFGRSHEHSLHSSVR